MSVLKTHTNSGRLRALAMSSAKRLAITPDIPTLAEASLKDYQSKSWNALAAPRQTPEAIVLRLNRAMSALLSSRATRARKSCVFSRWCKASA